MYAYRLEQFNLEGLVLREQDEPTPGPREVVVRVKAVSLNRRDLMILHRTYPLPAQPNIIPVSDGAGEVISVGSEVTRFKPGDRVAGNYFARWISGEINWDVGVYQLGCTLDGMLTEHALLSEDALVSIPAHLSYEAAATLPCAGVSAWSALTGGRGLFPGDTVLTLGTGGVAIFALQFAQIFGARVIAVTSSSEKAQQLTQLGADEVIDRSVTPQWGVAVRDLTRGEGVQMAVDTSGADTLEQSLRAAALGSEIAWISAMDAPNARVSIDAALLAASAVNIRRFFVGNRVNFEAMNRMIGQHQLQPVIDRIFDFSQVIEAYKHMESGSGVGKSVIRIF